MPAVLGIAPAIVLALIFIGLILYWLIFKKAGFSPWLSLLMLVPPVNIVTLYVIAFTDWKVVPIAPPGWPHPPYPPQPPCQQPYPPQSPQG